MANPFDVLRLPLCFLRTNYGRLALTVGALAAGIALVTAIEVVNRSVLQSFEDVIDTMAGRAALQVSAGNGAFFPEEVAERVAAVAGVELAAQVVTATAYLAGGSGELITVHGVDITNDAAVRVYEAGDAQRTRLADPLRFLNQPDSIILTEELTARHGLRIGDGIELETPVGRRRFTVRALLQPQGIARIHGGNLAVMDLFAAEAAFTAPGLINRLDVVVDRDGDVPRVQAAIAGVLPSGLVVAPPAQRKADLQRVMWAMQTVLRMVALLALGAAFLIAFNRLSTFFEERAWQHGVMRAIGVSRGGVRWELLKEGLLLGTGGVAIGVPLGMALARVLLPIIATTTAVSARLVAPRSTLVLGGWSVPLATWLGLMTALLAAARPAWRAAGVPVADTVRGRGTEQAGTRRTSVAARLAVWLSTAALVVVTANGGNPAWGLVATAGVLVGVAIAARPLLDTLATPLTQAAARYGSSGFFATVALTRRPGRTAMTIATLAVGFATVIWLWVVAQSFERTVVDVINGILRGDLAIGSAYSSDGFVSDPIDDAVLDEVRSIPGVDVVAGEQMIDWHYADGPIVVSAFDAAYVSGAFGDWPLVGPSAPDLAAGFAAGTMAIVSTSFALHLHARVGDVITLDTPGGPLPLRVGGVLLTLLSPRGTVMLSRETYTRHWNDPHIVHALIRASGDLAAIRTAIAAKLGQRFNLSIFTLREYADWSAGQIRQAFAGLYVLVGLILVVVVFGAADTLAAEVLERQRELAVARAVGVPASALRRIVLIQAGLLTGLGMVLAAAAGLALGVFWVQTMLPSMLGWVLDLHVPYPHLVIIGTVSVLVCLAAALGPARWAQRLHPAAALRYE